MSNRFPSFAAQKTLSPKAVPSGNLGFGQHFSDHVFLSHYTKDAGWFESGILPYGELKLDPACSVLHYAQSVFEGLKAFRTKDQRIVLFRPDFHAKRLQVSAEALCLPTVDVEDFVTACKQLVKCDQQFIPTGEGESLYIRPLLFASESFLGVRPANEITFLILTGPVGGYYGKSFEPTAIWVEEHASRVAPGGIGFVKASGNYAASLKAATVAKQKGFNQVLWLDACHHEFIEEVGTMNIFFRIGDKLITPNLTGNILPGCTRDSVLTLAKEHSFNIEERPISLQEVVSAIKAKTTVEAFGTGTAAVISPIKTIAMQNEELHFNQHEYAKFFYKEITQIQQGEVADTHHWISEV